MDIKSQRAHEALAPLMEQIGRTAAEHGVPFAAGADLAGVDLDGAELTAPGAPS